jgi:hypothetical protein
MNIKDESINKLCCNICIKTYSSMSSLCNHNKKFHNNNNIIMKSKVITHISNIIPQSDIGVDSTLVCKYCKKCFSHRNNRWRHEKSCNEKIDIIELEKIKLQQKEKDIEKMKEEKEILKLKIKLQNCKKLDNKTFKAVNKFLMDRSFKNSNNN